MNILKLTPSCKDYLWGGSRLRSDFGIKSDLNLRQIQRSKHPPGHGKKRTQISGLHQ